MSPTITPIGAISPFVRLFRTDFPISRAAAEIIRRPLDMYDHSLDRIGDPGRKLVEKIMGITGVVRVTIEPNLAAVEISAMAQWEGGLEVDLQVRQAFREVFGDVDFPKKTHHPFE